MDPGGGSGSVLARDGLKSDLKGHSIRGAAHMLLGRAGRFVVGLAATMILARLITPSDFGLVAMAMAFTGLALLLRDSGLSVATIQRAELTHAQVSNLFWANVGLSFLVAAVVVIGSPLIAWFYEEPRLEPIAAALAATVFLGGIGVQHGALLRRAMRHGALNVALFAAELAGVIAAMVAAVSGAGYWALVTRQVITATASSALLWHFSGWRPGRPVRGGGTWPLLSFGGTLTASQVLGYINRKVDDVSIGYALGAAPVGLYSRAYNLLLMPTVQLHWPMSAVVIPALSALHKEPDRYRRYYRSAVEQVAFCGYPLVVLLFIAADETVLTFLGAQWSGAIEIFRMLAPATLAEVSGAAASWTTVPYGRGDRELKWALIATPIYVAAVLTGLSWGVLGVAAAVSIARVLLLFPGFWFRSRETPVRLRDFLGAAWRAITAAIAAGIVVFLLESAWLGGIGAPATRLVVIAALYALLYAAIFASIPGGKQRLIELAASFRYLRRNSRPSP